MITIRQFDDNEKDNENVSGTNILSYVHKTGPFKLPKNFILTYNNKIDKTDMVYAEQFNPDFKFIFEANKGN